jgi:signal transduction histidine kinase
MNNKDQIVESIESAKGELEQALSHLQRLPSLDWSAVRYAAHSLGNFLNITTACIHLLNNALSERPDAEMQGYVHSLERTTELMVFVARHMTHASAASEVPLVREEVDLARMAQRASNFYQTMAEPKQLRVNCTVESSPAIACGDRIAAATVFDNLLSNAVKYSPRGKQIRVRVKVEPGHIVCSVQDEGPGIPTEDQQRLFNRGVRLGTATTGGEPSSGFGLAIAKDLLERMGGSIWCDSQPGQGACFSFRLPVYVKE